ncbi:MAG: sulfate ABC transporter permease subunit CysT [Firmicutes bacterium]|nr:sulfate ABC transporter permease subunit CysT [Lachnospiraceae bacterium]MDD6066631.1 sulfate ABC transporter permease subunit CysT [Bacillota bacterium]
MKKYQKETRVIPGFGLSMGVTMTMLCLIVIIPLTSIFWNTMDLSFGEFIETITSKRVLSGYKVSLICAFSASLINAVMGVILAWVLVRYSFPGKRILDGLIELPFALPTAIAGIALTSLTVDGGWIGQIFAKAGIHIAYTKIGITLALVFVGEPFVVRSIQPVLESLDTQYEEAAEIMGAGKIYTFFRVIFPEILPALLTGFGLAFARCLGEYGSVIFIAGNKPYSTEIAPLLIMAQLQEYDYAQATAIAIVMLVISFFILFLMNMIQIRAGKRTR